MSREAAIVAFAPVIFVVLWSTGFIGARYGLPYAEPMTFLAVRMGFVVAALAVIAWVSSAPRLTRAEIGHSAMTGMLVHGLYLGGVFTAIFNGVPVGISALIPGLQPLLMATIANLWLGEKVRPVQWLGLAIGLAGVMLVLHDRTMLGSGTLLGWSASVVSLIGITVGTMYQKRFGGGIDWRYGNLVQYLASGAFFVLAALAFETRSINWTGEFVFAIVWLVLVLSIGAVTLMYWLIRRSASAKFASLFYLVPSVTALMAYALFGEKLDAISISGMVVCALAVFLVNRAPARS
ncbi:MAG: DMT family transporter [Pseudolabrys sp.]